MIKKILIGTHNKGKFKEIAHLLPKKYKKISPFLLKISSPKETGKSFKENSNLKANFFSNFIFFKINFIAFKKPPFFLANLAE